MSTSFKSLMPLEATTASGAVLPAATDREFFTAYEWCLNPIAPVRDLLGRVREELHRAPSLPEEWQRRESAINLWLLVCAVSCAVDDYLAHSPWNAGALVRRFPRLRFPVEIADRCHRGIRALQHRDVARWKGQWDRVTGEVSRMLVAGGALNAHRGGAENAEIARREAEGESDCTGGAALPDRLARGGSGDTWGCRLPEEALDWHMRIPEAFRCQDLSHHDVIALALKYAAGAQPGPVAIVGVRTAGAYFAPLVAATLETRGFTASWMTVRPKNGLSPAEKRHLRKMLSGGVRVLLVDDHPNTGKTFVLMIGLLAGFGVRPAAVTVLAPEHPAQSDWMALLRPAKVVTLAPGEFFKRKLLDDPEAIRELIAGRGAGPIRIEPDPEVDAINRGLEAHYADGFQVRLKRVFRIAYRDPEGRPAVRQVLAKSVGWGWLGYHAWIAGERLRGHVPDVLGLREGLLFMEWVEGNSAPPPPETLGRYAAARARSLPLEEDPSYQGRGHRWTGWDALIHTLSLIYGFRLGRLKTVALRRALKPYVSPCPALIDGRMTPEDWAGGIKTDFEQHNFGGGELDIVDPVYDLAMATFDFHLSEDAERRLLDTYIRESGDRTVAERLPLYKLLCGVTAMTTAARRIARGRGGEPSNLRYLAARRFLDATMNRCCRRAATPRPAWSRRLFFLDVDGVFTWDYFGFAATTPSGIRALELLAQHGYSVVLNTGRSIDDVREYCRIHGLPGGAAEYGSVFFDAVRGLEIPLIDAGAAGQLDRCREEIRTLPGIFTDPAYRFAIRAWRYRGDVTRRLEEAETREFLDRRRFDALAFISRADDTYIVARSVDKGAALRAIKLYAGPVESTVAMGDSEQDLEMLLAADRGYMPGNCSRALRSLANGRYRRLRAPVQRGLLAAARDAVEYDGRDGAMPSPATHGQGVTLLQRLLHHADRSVVEKLIALLNPRGL